MQSGPTIDRWIYGITDLDLRTIHPIKIYEAITEPSAGLGYLIIYILMQPQGIHELKTLFSFKNDKWAYFSDTHDESGLPKISGSGPVPGMAAGTGGGAGEGGGGEGGVSKSNSGVIGGDDRDMTMTTTVDLDAASYSSSLATHPSHNNNNATNNNTTANNSEMSLSDPSSSTNQQPIYFPAHTSPLPSPASTRPNSSTRNRVYSLSSTLQHPSHTHPTSPTDPTRINTGRSSNPAGMCIYLYTFICVYYTCICIYYTCIYMRVLTVLHTYLSC